MNTSPGCSTGEARRRCPDPALGASSDGLPAALHAGRDRESERLLALHRASTALAAQTAEPDAVLDEVLRSAVDLLEAGSASLYLWDAEAALLRCVRNGEELPYVPVKGAVRHGPRPPRLPPIKGILTSFRHKEPRG